MTHFYLPSRRNRLLAVFTVFTLIVTGFAVASYAQRGDADAVSSVIQKMLAPGEAARNSLADSKAIESFYAGREYRPLWIDGQGRTDRAERALEVFDAAWTHGLNPDTYHAAEIHALLDAPAVDKARLELLTMDGALRYGRDLSGMRFNPKLIKQKAQYWRMPLSGGAVLQTISASSDPVKGLRGLEPNTTLYHALQKELVRLSEDDNGYDRFLPMRFGGHFTPGSRSKDVAVLRMRLGVSPSDSPLYDDETAAAVMTFQREHGLEPDGIIGPQTLAVLNRGNRERMEQVVANLERLRWLDQEKPDRYLLVNIPQQLLWGVDRGETLFETKVVVGMPTRKTKEFKAEVQGIRFNPQWNVPINLKMQDFLPKLQADPSYLTEKGIEVIRGHGSEAVTLDPTAVDWNSVGRKEMTGMRFVQRSGDHNALGRIRILMPNEYDIYMHDTNHPEYFARGQRTYSSGCIRLSEPKKVADFVLSRNEGWTEEDRDRLIAAGRTVEVKTAEPFPVYIVYQSIWMDGQGRLVYGPDVYDRDRELIKVLVGMNGFRLMGLDDATVAGLAKDGSDLAYNN